jgi:NADH dehydrogenase
MQQGRHAARNIIRLIEGGKTVPFKYLDKGQMATIGRRRAILQYKKLQLAGPLAWWGWVFVHIYYLIGFKNRLFVILQWAVAYLTWRRGARLVTNAGWKMTQGK